PTHTRRLAYRASHAVFNVFATFILIFTHIVFMIASNAALFPYTTLFTSAAGIFAAMKRVAWYRRYTRITGHKPTLGDPANQYPNVDTLPFWPRIYWKGKN